MINVYIDTINALTLRVRTRSYRIMNFRMQFIKIHPRAIDIYNIYIVYTYISYFTLEILFLILN